MIGVHCPFHHRVGGFPVLPVDEIEELAVIESQKLAPQESGLRVRERFLEPVGGRDQFGLRRTGAQPDTGGFDDCLVHGLSFRLVADQRQRYG